MDYAGTLMALHKVVPVTSWYAALKQREAWVVLCKVFLEEISVRPVIYDRYSLIYESTSVRSRLWYQYQRQTFFPASLTHLIQTEYS